MRLLELFTRFDGRIGRGAFWFSAGVVLAAMIMFNFAATQVGVARLGVVALVYPLLAVLAKRLHDRGFSGWWTMLIAAPVGAGFLFAVLARFFGANEFEIVTVAKASILGASMIVIALGFTELGVKPSQPEFNRHGPPPN